MGKEVLRPAVPPRQTFVQTEREAHVMWGKLAMRHPAAAATAHMLVALMDRGSSVAISHETLAKLVGCNERTVRRAIEILERDQWIQVLQLGKRGTVNVYVINSQVAFADIRDNLKLAAFSTRIVVDAADQDPATLTKRELRRLPIIVPPEKALPAGEVPAGETDYLPGMEPVIEAADILAGQP